MRLPTAAPSASSYQSASRTTMCDGGHAFLLADLDSSAPGMMEAEALTRHADGGAVAVTDLPELHLADWRPTKDTLHLYSQILGKIRLATAAPRNHWWNVPLYLDVRGLTTRRMHHGGTTFDITIDMLDHGVVVRTADGRIERIEIGDGLPVAEFDTRLHATLAHFDIDVKIKEDPFRVPMTTPFPQDVQHAAWDRDAIARFFRVVDWSDRVFEEFAGRFNGKPSPVHMFW